MSDEPPIRAMLASMPPYICRCGRTMGIGADGKPHGPPDWSDPGCQPGRCLCPHPCAYDCAGCQAHLCMDCDEPTTSEQTKTAVKWCDLCRLDGKHIGLEP